MVLKRLQKQVLLTVRAAVKGHSVAVLPLSWKWASCDPMSYRFPDTCRSPRNCHAFWAENRTGILVSRENLHYRKYSWRRYIVYGELTDHWSSENADQWMLQSERLRKFSLCHLQGDDGCTWTHWYIARHAGQGFEKLWALCSLKVSLPKVFVDCKGKKKWL